MTAKTRVPVLPMIGSSERNDHEARSLVRAAALIHESNGSVRDALYRLGEELKVTLRLEAEERGYGPQNASDWAREYAVALVDHTEQCWATIIVRASA